MLRASLSAPRPLLKHPLSEVALNVCVFVFFAAPLLYLVITALLGGASAGAVWRSHTGQLAVRTLLLAFCTTIWGLLLGVPFAWLVQRTDVPGRRMWRWLGSLPLAVPPYIGALSYLGLLGPAGLVNRWYQQSTGEFGLLVNIYGFWGAVFVLGLFTYPYVFLLVGSALETTNPSFEEAARSLGLRWWRVLTRVTLPLLRPSILSSALLIFLYALSDFGAVSMLRVTTFTTEIYHHLNTRFDQSSASILSLLLVIMTIVVLITQRRMLGRRRYVQTMGSTRPMQPLALGKWRWPAAAFPASVILLSIVVPISLLIYQTGSILEFLSTLSNQFIFIVYSLATALIAATLAVALAITLCYTASMRRRDKRSPALLAVQIGYAVPGTVLGLSLILLYNTALPWVYGTAAMVIIGYLVRFSPQAAQAAQAAFAQVHQHLDEAGRNLGHTSFGVLRRILLPLITPGIIASWTLVFISSMKELAATILLRPAGFDTLPVRIWIHTVEADYQQAAAIGLALITATALPLLYLNVRQPGRGSV